MLVLVLAAVLAVTTGPARAAGSSEPFDAMSFNVRAAPSDPAWSQRVTVVDAMFGAGKAPAVIGTQEATAGQASDLRRIFGSTYRATGPSRVAIFYDSARFEMRSAGDVVLPGQTLYSTLFPTMFPPRMATWARFVERTSGATFTVVNTHLDHISAPSRRQNAPFLARMIETASEKGPVVMTGDFNENAEASDPVHRALATETLLVDAWAAVRGTLRAPGTSGTYHKFTGTPGPGRIDWVLASPSITVHDTVIETGSLGGLYPSDHFPVRATITLPAR